MLPKLRGGHSAFGPRVGCAVASVEGRSHQCDEDGTQEPGGGTGAWQISRIIGKSGGLLSFVLNVCISFHSGCSPSQYRHGDESLSRSQRPQKFVAVFARSRGGKKFVPIFVCAGKTGTKARKIPNFWLLKHAV